MQPSAALRQEIAYQLNDLDAQLEACQRVIDATRECLAKGRRVYAGTLQPLEDTVEACKRVALLQSVLRLGFVEEE